ncbi:MAG: hypothetical protein RL201_80 [Actinomycetota bacterium]|jgi:Chaperone for flagella basal body P-ring formation
MNTQKKAAQTRFIVAVSLFAAAIISALALTALGNRTDSFWIAKRSLAPGSEITAGDITLTKVALGDRSEKYISNRTSLVGSYLLRAQNEGELISINEVSDLPPTKRAQQVPIAVRSADMPVDLAIGEPVNIYWVPESTMGGTQTGTPEIVVLGAYIRSIDRKTANFSSEVALTISLFDSQIIELLNSTVSGRLVIVRAMA